MENLKNKNLITIKEIVSSTSTFLYIVLMTMFYFVDDKKIFLIPLILYLANMFMVIEVLVISYRNKLLNTTNAYFWILLQSFANILGVIISFLVYKSFF